MLYGGLGRLEHKFQLPREMNCVDRTYDEMGSGHFINKRGFVVAKTLMVITVFLFVGAISEFVQPDPVTYHVPGQPVTINDVLATMTTSYLVKHAPGERQFLYVVLSALPIGLAYLWGAFDRKQAHRPKIARFFGGALFVLGSMSAGMHPAFPNHQPDKDGRIVVVDHVNFCLRGRFPCSELAPVLLPQSVQYAEPAFALGSRKDQLNGRSSSYNQGGNTMAISTAELSKPFGPFQQPRSVWTLDLFQWILLFVGGWAIVLVQINKSAFRCWLSGGSSTLCVGQTCRHTNPLPRLVTFAADLPLATKNCVSAPASSWLITISGRGGFSASVTPRSTSV